MDEYGPLKNRFEYNDKGMMLHVGENAARWSNLVGELVREFPMYYLSWHSNEKSKREHIIGRLMQNFDLVPHMRSKLWSDIKKGIEQHFAKSHWDKQIEFWLNPKHAARAAQNAQNRARSMVFCRQGSRSLAVLRDQHEEMLRPRYLRANTPSGVPYTKEEILALVRKGKQRGGGGAHSQFIGFMAGEGKTIILPINYEVRTHRRRIDEMHASRDKTNFIWIEAKEERSKRTMREHDLLRSGSPSDDQMSAYSYASWYTRARSTWAAE
ncbi:hypothetical protein Tco_0637719 [Tanacetum coccineum]